MLQAAVKNKTHRLEIETKMESIQSKRKSAAEVLKELVLTDEEKT